MQKMLISNKKNNGKLCLVMWSDVLLILEEEINSTTKSTASLTSVAAGTSSYITQAAAIRIPLNQSRYFNKKKRNPINPKTKEDKKLQRFVPESRNTMLI